MDNPLLMGLALGFLVLSLGIHEAAHAWVAYRCGDSTAKNMGRMTLNPIVHIDPFMTILLPAILFYTTGFIFGGAKPVPVNPFNLRHPLRDMMFVAAAGPATNVAIAVVLILVWKGLIHLGGWQPDVMLTHVVLWGAMLNVLLAVFNMVPIPGLDGSRVVAFFLPSGVREPYMAADRYMLFILIPLIVLDGSVFHGQIFGFVRDTTFVVFHWLDVLTGGTWT